MRSGPPRGQEQNSRCLVCKTLLGAFVASASRRLGITSGRIDSVRRTNHPVTVVSRVQGPSYEQLLLLFLRHMLFLHKTERVNNNQSNGSIMKQQNKKQNHIKPKYQTKPVIQTKSNQWKSNNQTNKQNNTIVFISYSCGTKTCCPREPETTDTTTSQNAIETKPTNKLNQQPTNPPRKTAKFVQLQACMLSCSRDIAGMCASAIASAAHQERGEIWRTACQESNIGDGPLMQALNGATKDMQ